MANLGIISDTHENFRATQEAFEFFAMRNVERIVHCGDVYAEANLLALKTDGRTRIPIDFVFGNVDDEATRAALKEYAADPANKARCFGDVGKIEWRGKRVFWTHGHLDGLLDDAIRSGEYDLICYGHTHRFEQKRDGKALVLNPGSIKPRLEGPCCCIVDENLQVERIQLSLGTIGFN